MRIDHRVVHEARSYDDVVARLRASAAAGATHAEVDVRVNQYGLMLSAHSPRTLDRSAWIADIEAPGDEVLFEWVLDGCVRAGLGVYLDVKALHRDGVPWLRKALDSFDVPMIVATHRTEFINEIRSLDRPVSVLYGSVDEDPVDVARSCGAQYVHPCWERLDDPAGELADGHLDRARSADLGLVTWHEERTDQLEKLVALGVDGICTDDIALLTAVHEGKASQ